MYPIAINHTSRIIPRPLVIGTIGWISACGAAGSSLLPFLTGAVASKFGIISLQPLYVFCQVCCSNANAYVKPGSDDDLVGNIMGHCTENSIIDLINKLCPLELLRITDR
jgi:hypothetical protein